MKKINKRITILGLFLISIALNSPLWAETVTLTGYISYVGKDHINLDDKIYSLKSSVEGVDMTKALMGNRTSSNINNFKVEVWFRGRQLTYETIYSGGPIEKAKVTLDNGLVSKIQILETF